MSTSRTWGGTGGASAEGLVALNQAPDPSSRDELGWEAVRRQVQQSKRRMLRPPCLSVLASRLIRRERARALDRKPLDLQAYALEEAGRRWAEGRARQSYKNEHQRSGV